MFVVVMYLTVYKSGSSCDRTHNSMFTMEFQGFLACLYLQSNEQYTVLKAVVCPDT